MSAADEYSIAIVGMACRFPGARTPDELWRNLRAGVESIRFFSAAELAAVGVDPSVRADPSYVPAGGALGEEEIALFDAAFFGLSPRDAELMDPQHRLFLECAWEALESGGYDPDRYRKSIGVFAGAAMSSYLLRNLMSRRDERAPADGLNILFGNDRDSLATRASYKLNLRGPSYSLQTFCSTSLVAVHVACQSLIHRECDMALAGGVTLTVPQAAGYLYAEGGLLSPDGHCRAFDAAAQGTPMGSGVGLVLLKPLDAALKDGDTIRAVIRGSAINNDGGVKVSYAAPSVEGQAAVIAEALAAADVHPDTVSYVEAHGTATALGDPIEIAALDKAFKRKTTRRGFCAIGSVKTNIGHLDRAAGIAGLIKAVLALEHEELPPSLHFEKPNPQIDFERTAFFVNAQLRPWEGPRPLRAGVSAFGVGGTNAHVVLEQAPKVANAPASQGEQLLVVSARTRTALDAAGERLARHLADHPEQSLADVAYTLQVGRRHFNHRRAVWCATHEQAVAALSGRDPERVLTGETGSPPGGDATGAGLQALARRWLEGREIDWAALARPERRRRVPLPSYPFERRRFWIDAAAPQGAPRPLPAEEARKKPDIADWFYLPAWRQAPRLSPVAERMRWLLLADAGGVARELAEMLRAANHDVVMAHPSERFGREADGRFGVRPESTEDLLAVLQALGREQRTPQRVVHLWGLDSGPFHGLLAIGRALGELQDAGGVGLDVVTRGACAVTGEEHLQPDQALALGPCLVLPQESPSIACRMVDVAGAAEPSEVAAPLARELCAGATERVIALRHGKRWRLQFDPVRLEPGAPRTRRGGVYLVTGGLGGIGLVAARVLAEAGDVKLVLTTRSPFPAPDAWDGYLAAHPPEDPVSQRIQKLRALKAEVVVETADAADGARMREVVERAVKRFGAIHGVVHAAGVVSRDSFRTIQEMGREDCGRHLRPKVHGVLALEQAVAGRPLDFCLLVSSVSATLGGLGYGAYAAANAFMDAFAQARAASGAPWMAVEWSDWSFGKGGGGGLATSTLAGTEMDPDEGAETLRRALSLRDQPLLIHSTFALAGRIAQWVEGFSPARSEGEALRAVHPRPDLPTPFVECQTEPERLIAAIWRQLLGVDRVGRHDSFFELGGNSLLGTQLVERLRKRFGVRVPLRALLEVRTPADTALLVEELLIDALQAASGSGT